MASDKSSNVDAICPPSQGSTDDDLPNYCACRWDTALLSIVPCVPSPIPQFDLAAAPCGGSQESQPRIRKLQGYRGELSLPSVIIRSED
jgi:hypothetical protein